MKRVVVWLDWSYLHTKIEGVDREWMGCRRGQNKLSTAVLEQATLAKLVI